MCVRWAIIVPRALELILSRALLVPTADKPACVTAPNVLSVTLVDIARQQDLRLRPVLALPVISAARVPRFVTHLTLPVQTSVIFAHLAPSVLPAAAPPRLVPLDRFRRSQVSALAPLAQLDMFAWREPVHPRLSVPLAITVQLAQAQHYHARQELTSTARVLGTSPSAKLVLLDSIATCMVSLHQLVSAVPDTTAR